VKQGAGEKNVPMTVRLLTVSLVVFIGSAGAAPTGSSPTATVSALYAQVLAATHKGGGLEVKPYLEPSFYSLIERVFARQDECFKKSHRCLLVDWDIYDGAQVPMFAYLVEAAKTKITGTSAIVPVKLTLGWHDHNDGTLTMLVKLTKTASGWLISDLMPPDPSSPSKTYSTRALFEKALVRPIG
jgi:hypothetical protein